MKMAAEPEKLTWTGEHNSSVVATRIPADDAKHPGKWRVEGTLNSAYSSCHIEHPRVFRSGARAINMCLKALRKANEGHKKKIDGPKP